MRQTFWALALACGLGAGAAAAESVDLELVLLADASGSIDHDEIRFQRQGYAGAITHPRDLRVRHAMMVVAYSWYAAGLPAGLFDDAEMRHGIHAGAIETSMMLYLRPDLVRMDLAADFSPLMSELAGDYRHLSPTGAGRLAWMAQDLHPSGACGDARNADAERGRALVEHAAQALVALLREVDRYPLERLRPWPGAAIA